VNQRLDSTEQFLSRELRLHFDTSSNRALEVDTEISHFLDRRVLAAVYNQKILFCTCPDTRNIKRAMPNSERVRDAAAQYASQVQFSRTSD
jgi:hypothetical protein